MNKWKYFLRSHFGFTQKETNGFIYLIGFLFLALLITIGIFNYYPEASSTTIEDKKILAQLLNQIPERKPPLSHNSENHLPNDFFNPNTISEKDLAEIFGKKLASVIINYRNKGGYFYKKEDMLRIYGMDKMLYDKIQPWIKIENDNSHIKSKSKSLLIVKFDINKADTTELQKLKGIGKILAARIIKFRDKLGGFYTLSQYEEVYGLQTEVLNELKSKTYIREDFQPVKISLNNSVPEELFSHPYIGKKLGYSILNHKKYNGEFKAIEELKSVKEISEQAYFKILPYIVL